MLLIAEETMAVMVPPRIADQLPSTMSGTCTNCDSQAAAANIKPFITTAKKPKVSRYNGNASTLAMGRSAKFTVVKMAEMMNKKISVVTTESERAKDIDDMRSVVTQMPTMFPMVRKRNCMP